MISLLCLLGFVGGAQAIDFFFVPDTVMGDVGDTVELSGQISASDLMRGFTVYLVYDTNVIDLSAPPVAGSLIANQEGLQFSYFDHVPIHPDRLEIGGTVFGEDFWAGPGELFHVRFVLRTCADAPITLLEYQHFVDASGGYPTVTFYPAVAMICPRIPAEVAGLTIYPAGADVILRWPDVTADYLGRPLLVDPTYLIYRQQILPTELPVMNIASTADTVFVEPLQSGEEYLYYIVTETSE